MSISRHDYYEYHESREELMAEDFGPKAPEEVVECTKCGRDADTWYCAKVDGKAVHWGCLTMGERLRAIPFLEVEV